MEDQISKNTTPGLEEKTQETQGALYSVSTVKHLDVDAVLTRSLPECHSESLPSFQEKFFFWRRRKRQEESAATIDVSEEVLVPAVPHVVRGW